MEILKLVKLERPKTLKWQIVLAIVGIIAGAGILGYYYSGFKIWQASSKLFQKLPAAVLNSEKKLAQEETPAETLELIIPEAGKYVETAETGEGITHLSRRALKKYLQENQRQDFEITLEHKIYMEDYLAKKMGGGVLKLGEKIEFSEDLIKEAVQKAETLTPEQLQNLQQYSQLVSPLNY